MGSFDGKRERLAETESGLPEVMVWCGKRLGRIGASEGEDSVRRKSADSIVGWLRWIAEVSVPKPQLTEIQAAERKGRRMG